MPFDQAQQRSKKRIALSVFVAVAILLMFWLNSRYPALDMKQAMGDRNLIFGIAFDSIIETSSEESYWNRVLANSINWYYTNWKGMTFSVFFAAAILSLFGLLSFRWSRNKWLGLLSGTAAGATIGVCVNCAAPIGYGLQKSFGKAANTLSVVMSSPTLNFVVLSMAFTLFPLHMAVAKVFLTLVTVLLIVPALCHLLLKENNRKTNELMAMPWQRESWGSAIAGFFLLYCEKFKFIFVKTVPFMFVAGFLGVALIEILPMNLFENLEASWISLFLVGLVGSFLPVPIAFDVVLVDLLLQAGLPHAFAMVLLFSLGIFSIYPMLLFRKLLSLRLTVSIFLAIAILGVLAGKFTFYFESYKNDQVLAKISQSLQVLPGFHEDPTKAVQQYINESCKGEGIRPVKKCVQQLSIRYAVLSGDLKICDPLDDKTKSNCLLRISNDLIREKVKNCLSKGKPKKCLESLFSHKRTWFQLGELCKSDKAAICRKVNAIMDAKVRDDYSFCSQFDSQKLWKNICLREFGSRLTSVRKFSFSGQVDSLADYNRLTNGVELGQFVEKSICAKINSLHLRDSCLLSLMVDKNFESKTLSNCNQLSSKKAKDQCATDTYSVFSERMPGADFCNELHSSNESRMNCLAQTKIEENFIKIRTSFLLSRIARSDLGERRRIKGRDQKRLSVQLGKTFELSKVSSKGGVKVMSAPFQKSKNHKSGFKRYFESELNMNLYHFSPIELEQPFFRGRGIASGDFNNDTWPDFVVADETGIALFANRGSADALSERFVRIPISVDGIDISQLSVFVVAFADMNNDGWSDIVFASYGGINGIILNSQGSFASAKWIELPGKNRVISRSMAIGDINRNSFLDLFFGNWVSARSPHQDEKAKNELILDPLQSSPAEIEASSLSHDKMGPTLASLISDINSDGFADLLVANDFIVPDEVYLGGESGLTPVTRSQGLIPATPTFSMSYDSADIDNDLSFEVFAVDADFGPSDPVGYCQFLNPEATTQCETINEIRSVIFYKEVDRCGDFQFLNFQVECLISILRTTAIELRSSELCEQIPQAYMAHRQMCLNMVARQSRKYQPQSEDLNQLSTQNTLWIWQNDRYEEVAAQFGVTGSFWSWNAKFADLDNDGWQDLYVANGNMQLAADKVQTNVFFKNEQGQKFVQRHKEFGLEDFQHSPTFTYIDFDLDGDIDIIVTGVNAPLRIYENLEAKNSKIQIALNDSKGNKQGIGSKIIVTTINRQRYIREIKLSGGFASFDNPVAHFGLGSAANIQQIKVIWPNGDNSIVHGPLPVNHFYKLMR